MPSNPPPYPEPAPTAKILQSLELLQCVLHLSLFVTAAQLSHCHKGPCIGGTLAAAEQLGLTQGQVQRCSGCFVFVLPGLPQCLMLVHESHTHLLASRCRDEDTLDNAIS